MPEHDTGQRLYFQVPQRRPLLLCEIAHLRLGEPNVVEIVLAHLPDRALDLRRRKFERRRRPIIEFLRQLAHRGILVRVNIGEDLFDHLTHLGVGRLDRACVHSALEVAGHYIPPNAGLDPAIQVFQNFSAVSGRGPTGQARDKRSVDHSCRKRHSGMAG